MARSTSNADDVRAAERRQAALEERRRAADHQQFDSYEGRQWAYELMDPLFRDPGPVPDPALREWLGSWRVAQRLWGRLWAHPELGRQAMVEAAQRAKAERDDEDIEQRAREERDKKTRAGELNPALDTDYAP